MRLSGRARCSNTDVLLCVASCVAYELADSGSLDLPGARDDGAMDDDLEQAIAAFQRCIEDRDRDTAARVLDEDYALVLVSPTVAVMPRARWLEVLPDYVVHNYRVDEQVIDEDGDCGTVLHRVRMTATVLSEDRSGVFVITDIWRRRDRRWLLWRRHSTPLSAGSLPGVT
jgi:ketosteroid isomerase-like protein